MDLLDLFHGTPKEVLVLRRFDLPRFEEQQAKDERHLVLGLKLVTKWFHLKLASKILSSTWIV